MKYKSIPIQILDKEMNDIINVSQLSQDLDTNDVELLVQKLVISKQILSEISTIYTAIKLKFLDEMKKNNAKKYYNDEVEILINAQYNYEYNNELIDSLLPLIGQEKFDEIFKKQYKVNRNALKTIQTLGTEVQDLTDKMQNRIVLTPTISINKK